MKKRIVIIGGGIVGLSTAYKLLAEPSDNAVTVLEKEGKTGQHQTANNSGVLHCGLYYKPGSLKARMAVEGIREMVEFCQHHHIPHEICGKLVVAVDAAEQERLLQLEERGLANGLRGLRRLNREQMREIEPHVGGIAGLHVPQEGIVDYPLVCEKLVAEIQRRGGVVRVGAGVRALGQRSGVWHLETAAGKIEADFIVNCAGLHCDRVSEWAGEKRTVRIVPFRGEYFKLKPGRESLVRHLIYPVPDPQFPFLGVHFTRLIEGGVEAGPNAVLALKREGYRKTDFSLRDTLDAVTFSGLWKFLAKHRAMSLEEIKRSLSKRLFCQSLQRLVPEVQPEDLVQGGAGVRAQAMTPEGELVQDFHLLHRPEALHVLNAPSPAATASFAIAGEIIRQMDGGERIRN